MFIYIYAVYICNTRLLVIFRSNKYIHPVINIGLVRLPPQQWPYIFIYHCDDIRSGMTYCL